MSRKLFLSVVAVISGFLTLIISVYSDAIRQAISSYLGVPDVTIAFYALIVPLAVFFVACVLFLGYSIYRWYKSGIVIQEGSLRFNKYPRIVGLHGNLEGMSNMSYAEVTVYNRNKTKVDDCGLEVSLRRDNADVYKSKVLSSDSTAEPNPISLSIDGEASKGFHPVCLRLASFEAFLPNHSLGVGGAFTGTLVEHGRYEIFGRTLYEGKCGKWISIGGIVIPNDFVDKAKIPNDVQVILNQGGFTCYLELNQGKVRAKFFGNPSNDDIINSIRMLGQIDDIIEVNGIVRKRPPLGFFA